MSLSKAFISATKNIRAKEINKRSAQPKSIQWSIEDYLAPTRIAWRVYLDTEGDKLHGLQNYSDKDIQGAKAKLTGGPFDVNGFSKFSLERLHIDVPSELRLRTLRQHCQFISRPTLNWIKPAASMSLTEQFSQPVIRSYSNSHHQRELPENVPSHKLFYLLGSAARLESEILGIFGSMKWMPIPLESLPDLYTLSYSYDNGRFLAQDGYQSLAPNKAWCNLQEALSEMQHIELYSSPDQRLTILVKDAAIVNPFKICIYCAEELAYSDVAAYFRNFEGLKNVLVLTQKATSGFLEYSSETTVKNILSKNTCHKMWGYDVALHHFHQKHHKLTDWEPSPDPSNENSDYHIVMGFEEACYIQFLEEEYLHKPEPLLPINGSRDWPTLADSRSRVRSRARVRMPSRPRMPSSDPIANLPVDPFNMEQT